MAKNDKKDPLNRDLSSLMKSGRWLKFNQLFELQPKNKTITIRVSEDLLKEIKKIAESENTDYQKLIRALIADYVTKKAS